MPQLLTLLHTRLLMVMAVAIAAGLLTVPVECSVAAGPHSLFIAADAVAALQAGSAGAAQSAHRHAQRGLGLADASGMQNESMAMPGQPSGGMIAGQAHRSHAPGKTGVSATGMTDVPPSPASFSSDAIVALALPGFGAARVSMELAPLPLPDFRIPLDHVTPGPEPPPP